MHQGLAILYGNNVAAAHATACDTCDAGNVYFLHASSCLQDSKNTNCLLYKQAKHIATAMPCAVQGQDKFEVVEGGFSCALDLVKYIR